VEHTITAAPPPTYFDRRKIKSTGFAIASCHIGRLLTLVGLRLSGKSSLALAVAIKLTTLPIKRVLLSLQNQRPALVHRRFSTSVGSIDATSCRPNQLSSICAEKLCCWCWTIANKFVTYRH